MTTAFVIAVMKKGLVMTLPLCWLKCERGAYIYLQAHAELTPSPLPP